AVLQAQVSGIGWRAGFARKIAGAEVGRIVIERLAEGPRELEETGGLRPAPQGEDRAVVIRIADRLDHLRLAPLRIREDLFVGSCRAAAGRVADDDEGLVQ